MNIEKLCPVCKDYLWGGHKLKESYGKVTDCTPCAESWELSFHPDGMTRLEDGRTLAQATSPEALGTNVADFPFFPVMIKFIDARSDLSVQVHPSDDYALTHESSLGKTEMWYVAEAEPGAGIYLGFSRDVTAEEYRAAIAEERLTELLNFYPVKAGDCYFIPAGTIHAIGAGCLICEIQQNSNLTYRVYDYGRRDKDGNPRQLHVEKALRVTNLRRYAPAPPEGDLLGCSRYFSVRKQVVRGTYAASTDPKSFHALTCVKGCGTLNGRPIRQGDSFFVPAGDTSYRLEGDLEIITTEIRKFYLGIDLGGTFIKGGILDDTGRILAQDKIPTQSETGAEGVSKNIARLCQTLTERLSLTSADLVGIGMGVPGMIDSARGEVVYSNNLNWKHFAIGSAVETLTGLPVKIANDANVAALGEAKFGCGKHLSTTCMLTLGTGVGGGIVIDGKLFEGNRSAGAELGHAVIVADGEPCTCGRRGCLEAYASATALIRDTRRAMEAHPESALWSIAPTLADVDGKTAFACASTDPTAQSVVNRYIRMLGTGIVNLANEFRPEAIILGGGVCAEGDALIRPLKNFLDREIFAGDQGPSVQILTASLGNSAGLLGAAALWM